MGTDATLDRLLREYLWRQAPVIALCLDQHGVVSDASAYARDLLGETVLGKRFEEVTLNFAGDIDLDELAGRDATGVMLSLGTRTGMPQTFRFSFSRHENGVISMGSADPAEQLRLGQHVLDINADLNNLTRELHKRNAELVEVSRLKDMCLGMAAHDLRKPLGLILGFTPDHRNTHEDGNIRTASHRDGAAQGGNLRGPLPAARRAFLSGSLRLSVTLGILCGTTAGAGRHSRRAGTGDCRLRRPESAVRLEA